MGVPGPSYQAYGGVGEAVHRWRQMAAVPGRLGLPLAFLTESVSSRVVRSTRAFCCDDFGLELRRTREGSGHSSAIKQSRREFFKLVDYGVSVEPSVKCLCVVRVALVRSSASAAGGGGV